MGLYVMALALSMFQDRDHWQTEVGGGYPWDIPFYCHRELGISGQLSSRNAYLCSPCPLRQLFLQISLLQRDPPLHRAILSPSAKCLTTLMLSSICEAMKSFRNHTPRGCSRWPPSSTTTSRKSPMLTALSPPTRDSLGQRRWCSILSSPILPTTLRFARSNSAYRKRRALLQSSP